MLTFARLALSMTWLETAIVLAVSQVTGAPALQAQDPEYIHFHDSYEAAMEEARATGKPIFLEFRCAP